MQSWPASSDAHSVRAQLLSGLPLVSPWDPMLLYQLLSLVISFTTHSQFSFHASPLRYDTQHIFPDETLVSLNKIWFSPHCWSYLMNDISI